MYKMQFVVIVVLIMITSIYSTESKSKNQNDESKNKAHKMVPSEFIYRFENDTIKQECIIDNKTDSSITFKIKVLNKFRNKKAEFLGKAEGHNNIAEGTEYFGNDDDDALLVMEYYYQDKCYIHFDIEDETGNAKMLLINEDSCDSLHDKYCPFKSVGTMLRVKKK